MPSKERRFNDMLRDFLKHLKKRQRAADYINECKYKIKFFRDILDEGGLETNPRKIQEREIAFLFESLDGYEGRNGQKILVSTKRQYFNYFNTFLKYYKNYVIQEMDLRWPRYQRQNVRWLNMTERRKLLDSINLEERLLVILEMGMGLRNIEVQRLTLNNIDLNSMTAHVQGKGTMGGKWRTVPIHPAFVPVYEDYLLVRKDLIAEASRRLRKPVPDPGYLFIYRRGRKIKTKKYGALLTLVYSARRKSGVIFSNHDLRRTFGRDMFFIAKVTVPEIARIMGHESTAQTIRYLGLEFLNMQNAMKKYADSVPMY